MINHIEALCRNNVRRFFTINKIFCKILKKDFIFLTVFIIIITVKEFYIMFGGVLYSKILEVVL